MHVIDEDAGLGSGEFRFCAPSFMQQVPRRLSDSDRVSGTPQDGIYTAQIVIPQSAEPGRWDFYSVGLTDGAGNAVDYGIRSDYAPFPDGTPGGIEVADTQPDLEIPQLISFDFEPKHVDASENPQVIIVTARLADNFTGFDSGGFKFVSPSGEQELLGGWADWWPSSRVAGNAQDGIYTASVTVPKSAEVGTWNLRYIYFYDQVLNYDNWGPYYRKEFPVGTPTEIIVAPVVQTSATGYTVNEEEPAAKVTVIRGGDPSVTATVHLETTNGTAQESTDFSAVSADVAFAAGERSKQVAIPLLHRGTGDGDQHFNVALSSPRGAILGAQSGSVVRLADSTAPPAIQWDADSYTAREGQGTVAVTLVRTGLARAAATVHYATQDGSARRGADYRRVSGDVTFAPGQRSKTIVIPVLQDAIDELTESFFVKLSAASGASLPQPLVRVKIVDDDPVPTVQWSVPDYSAKENGGYAVLTATLMSRKSTRVTVRYGTIDDTATSGSDYSTVSGEIAFLPGGPMTQTVRIPINSDVTPENSESFKVILTGSASAMIGNNSTAAVTISE